MKHLIRHISWPLLSAALLLTAFVAGSMQPSHTRTSASDATGAQLVGTLTSQQAREDLARRGPRWHTGGSALQIGDFTRRLDRPQPAVLPG